MDGRHEERVALEPEGVTVVMRVLASGLVVVRVAVLILPLVDVRVRAESGHTRVLLGARIVTLL
jgi:hypothetical protein